MFALHRLMALILVLVSPARLVAAIPAQVPAQIHANVEKAPYNLTLDTTQPAAVKVETAPKPNFDTEVLQPLQEAQAKAADEAAKAKEAPVVAAKSATPVIVPGTDALAQLRLCEAGGDYAKNTGNGYFGAYQYDIGTWNNYGGFARADLAPPSVQDEKVKIDVARRGFSPWPYCARKLGLM